MQNTNPAMLSEMSDELLKNSNDKNGEPSVIWDKLDKEDDAEDIIWDDDTPSPIQEFYKDQTVFITGATGFLGSLLVEKLLRCCPQIRKLILLIRKGKSNSVDERVKDYFNDTVFDRLRLTNPNYHEKVDIVTGHIDAQDFDLTPHEEHLLISQTTIIFHIAATVRFDEHIRTAYNINVRGTETALALAKRMKRLKSFIHVSTAYCNCDRKYIAETFYPPVFTAKELSIILQYSSDEEIALLNEYLLGGKPNSYTLTKATAEDLVREVAHELPICVFRPSIVFPTLQEPMPLWNKGSNALITSCYTSGIGLLRVSLMDSNIAIDIVPGDRTINAMTALAWYHSTQQPNKERPTVFNYVSYNDNRLGLGEFLSVALKHAFAAEESCPGILWPASTYFVSNSFLYQILFLVLHFTPALVFSLAERWYNRKPQIMRFYRKLTFLNKAIEYFATKEWHFKNNNIQAMVNEMSQADRIRFDPSLNFRWDTVALNLHRSIALYVMNERVTKQYYQTKFIYKKRLHFCIYWFFYVSVAYWFLRTLANLINSYFLL
ncbi:hypothetical protein M8J76_005479 [Diaphorina citri]|nr:hypothetical protein M8J76_005479 [Diaphorina citri]